MAESTDPVHDQPGPRLTRAQRAQLLKWIASGITDYPAIKQLLIKHRFPVIQRQALDYYYRRYGRQQPSCPMCKRPFEPSPDSPAAQQTERN
jgi:hypothetical protein